MDFTHSKQEYILCAAIWINDEKEHVHQPKNIKTGYVICGRRHHNCFAIYYKILKKESELDKRIIIQGFLTNKDRFVNRLEAAIIAKESHQIPEELQIHKLFSEHLY